MKLQKVRQSWRKQRLRSWMLGSLLGTVRKIDTGMMLLSMLFMVSHRCIGWYTKRRNAFITRVLILFLWLPILSSKINTDGKLCMNLRSCTFRAMPHRDSSGVIQRTKKRHSSTCQRLCATSSHDHAQTGKRARSMEQDN